MISKMKRITFLWGALLFMVTIVMLYMMLDTLNTYPKSGNGDSQQFELMESKITKIEAELAQNQKLMQQIRAEVSNLLPSGQDAGVKGNQQSKQPVKIPSVQGVKVELANESAKSRKEETYEVSKYNEPKMPDAICLWPHSAFSKPDINMHQVIAKLPFDNPDGGAWKQGWQVTYSNDRWTASNKLKIVLVPHTHCDPGWIKTYADYYRTQTKRILDNFVPKLEENPKYKFMFSEMSYFSWWWSEIGSEMKERVKRLIAGGQFEISTGGWVMTDEANAHYFAMLDQLIEGNQWLNSTLGYVPQSGWSIDPFGYSSTMAYLLKRSDFKSMLIQRIHYSIKKYLAKERQLEFMWRQHWDSSASTDIFTHMMPFYSYDVPHTCGPEPAICCQFDFRRLPGSSYRCPWKFDPKAITQQNVGERTRMILDQWKKKATLYKTNVVLIPLGDDFRYMQPDEFDLQFGNYEKIFEYLDNHPELGAEGQFGTLTDYFNELYKETDTTPGQKPQNIPSLSGDFFSYADRDDHYWTGYFTSRPIQKHLDRCLEHNLRSAEIIFSLAQTQARKNNAANFPSKTLMELLVEARRTLGLFQHHDAITGTAKDFVVIDYGKKLLKAIQNTKFIISECSVFLLLETKTDYKMPGAEPLYNVDELRASHDSLPTKPVLELTDTPKSVMLYNSLAQPRTEVVKIWTNWPYVQVKDPSGEIIHSQAEPFWSDRGIIAMDKFKISFVADMAGLSIMKYTITKVENGKDTKNHIAQVALKHSDSPNIVSSGPFSVKKVTVEDDFKLETKFLSAVFSGTTGLLKSVKTIAEDVTYKSELEFIQYGTVMAKDKSGAYLFLPDGDAKILRTSHPPYIRIIQGPIASEVHVFTEFIQHVMRLHNSPGTDGASIDMYNIVDIKNTHNKEVGMRLNTGVDNGQQIFYSDLNGFQMQKRQYYKKLTLQGNVYPMPSMAYLQDKTTRVSVLSSQSAGVANLVPGAIDVMFDRRLNQDDNRGLGQGVLDNHPTPSRFRILFESRMGPPEMVNPESSFPSMLGQLSSLALIHPIFAMPRSNSDKEPPMQTEVKLLQDSLPCELHMLNFRVLQNSDDHPELRFVPKETSLLLLRHLPSDCGFPAQALTCKPNKGEITLASVFAGAEVKKSTVTSLTMNKQLAEIKPTSFLQVPAMEIMAIQVKLS